MQDHWAIVGAGIAGDRGRATARRCGAAGDARRQEPRHWRTHGDATLRRPAVRPWRPVRHRPREIFSAALAGLEAEGHAAPWAGQGHVGTPGMSALPKGLAAGLTVLGNQEIRLLGRGPAGWTLSTADGPAAVEGNGGFAGVVLAVPAPQAMPLATSAGVAWPGLAGVRYAPCWALMLAFDQGALDLAQSLRPSGDAAIGWIARDDSKPGRQATRGDGRGPCDARVVAGPP
jgi:renalase